MSWKPKYPPNFTIYGDKTHHVLDKHIKEFKRLYEVISQQFDAINGHKHDGTLDSGPSVSVDWANVTIS